MKTFNNSLYLFLFVALFQSHGIYSSASEIPASGVPASQAPKEVLYFEKSGCKKGPFTQRNPQSNIFVQVTDLGSTLSKNDKRKIVTESVHELGMSPKKTALSVVFDRSNNAFVRSYRIARSDS